jgi:short-subunit dehydrogenase
VADKGIEIQSVCPGPVDTPFIREIFGTQINSQTTKVSLSVTTIFFPWGGGGSH